MYKCTVYSCTCQADTHVAGVVGLTRDRHVAGVVPIHVAGDVPIHVAGDVGGSGQAFNIDNKLRNMRLSLCFE